VNFTNIFTYVVNFINILKAAFMPIFVCPKNYMPNFKYTKAASMTFVCQSSWLIKCC
jgi:hypothetical protein